MVDAFDGIVKSLHDLRTFLQSAPTLFGPNDTIRRHVLPNAEIVSCVKWDEDFFISGTDILRCIMYRFSAFGRNILNRARFEEFVFSDLRSLKTNVRVRLEEGKSDLLEYLHDNGCIRTKKKQRVFYWEAVPHDQLFLDSLERELRRAVIDDANNEMHRITVAIKEPALSMRYDPLMKVAHQIPKILSETRPDHMPIMCAVFGVPFQQDRGPSKSMPSTCLGPVQTRQQSEEPSMGTSFPYQKPSQIASRTPKASEFSNPQVGLGAWLPPPQMNSQTYQNVHLPSIQDALPPHAYMELLPMPVRQGEAEEKEQIKTEKYRRSNT